MANEIDRRTLLKLGAAGVAALAGISIFQGAVRKADAAVAQPKTERTISADVLPEVLPPHIAYFKEAARVISGNAKVFSEMSRGDIELHFGQQLDIAGNVYGVDPTNHPDTSMVFAVVAANDLTLEYRTFDGVTVWTGREKTDLDRNNQELSEDVNVAGKVQVVRSRIKGNCTPEGCKNTRLITTLAHKDADGVVRHDLISDVTYTR